MDSILPWNIAQKTPAAQHAQEYQQRMQGELETMVSERERVMKKAGKKSTQYEEIMGPIRRESYKYIPEDLMVELLKNRLASEDCNAGVMFDNLEAEEVPSAVVGLKVVMRAVGE